MGLLETLSANLQDGYADRTKKGTEEALAANIPLQSILNDGLIAGMDVVGKRFKNNEIFLPEVLLAARAMKMGMDVLKPHLAAAKVKSRGKIVLGTVKGDIHDIGKNLVAIMFQGAGFEVIDLGTDVSKEKFADAVRREQPDILGLSALLTTTMLNMKQVIEFLDAEKIRNNIKVIVGGAPLSSKYANEIKADGYAREATSAVAMVKSMMTLHETSTL